MNSYMSCCKPLLLLIILLFSSPSVMIAQVTDQDDQWNFGVGLYGWLPKISGSTASGSDVDVNQGELIDALQMTLQGILSITKGKWSFALDIVYLSVGDDQSGVLNVPTGNVNTNTNVDLQTWIVTPTIGYQLLEDEKGKLNFIVGARYLSLDLDVNINIATSPPRTPRVSDSGGIWDGIIGLHGEVTLNEQWYLPFYLDIGTGESDLTWQAALSVGYRFNSFDVVAGYRYLNWDLSDNPALDDLTVNGPYAGLKFFF